MERLRLIAAYGILSLWGVALVLSTIFDKPIEPGLTTAALAVVTFLFGLGLLERIKKNGG